MHDLQPAVCCKISLQCVSACPDHYVQQLGSRVSAGASGAGAGRRRRRVQKQLLILKSVDNARDVPHKGLRLFGRHRFGESAALKGEE